ncbi:MAG: sugar phosphate nucleotidyltransferase [Desulfobacterota bacterium]|nr:sugar phosphate nucleotidyltransferase [Thermodesulfobacteriota bacterium]
MITSAGEERLVKLVILAAGVGSRLYPLTSDRPKAMIEINGKTIIEKQIE